MKNLLKYQKSVTQVYRKCILGTSTIKHTNYKHPSKHEPKILNDCLQLTTIDFEEEKFYVCNCPFKILKAPVISLPPNAPNQTMRDNHPNSTIMMSPKLSLPTSFYKVYMSLKKFWGIYVQIKVHWNKNYNTHGFSSFN